MRICSKLNQMRLNNMRREHMYEAIMTDLVALGIVNRQAAEQYLGFSIPEYNLEPLTKPVTDKKVAKTLTNSLGEIKVTA